jgi:hypothetical protein
MDVDAFWGFLDLRKHAGKDLEAQLFLIAQTIVTALKDADFVVETLDEAEGDFVVGMAIRGNAVPVTVDHLGECLIGLEPLSSKCRFPVLEEAPCPDLAPVVPQLARRTP